jgi:UDP-2-acetamido-3-amino-2,3-dideoxy-glucuronate N-acetyltransferase
MKNYFSHETAIIDEGAEIGSGTKIWHFSHIMSTAKLGEKCIVAQNVFIGANVILGDGVKVQNNVSIFDGVVCEDNVFIGPSVVFTNVKLPRSAIDRKHQFAKTSIGKGASLGANSTIICGNEIGDFALVGAGSVVTKPVIAHALVVGNPAKQIGWVSRNGCRLLFDKFGFAFCEETNEKYKLVDESSVIICD